MLRNRFNVSGQTLVVSLVTTTLLYGLFSMVQPIGSALAAALLQATGVSQTVPPYLNYQGTLRDAEGKPISGVHKLTFRIYKDVTAPLPEAVWMEEHAEVTVRDGQFSVLLGNNKPVPPELFTGPDLFIGVTVAPLDEMVPRQRFASAPYAMFADHAAALTAPNGSSTHAVHVDNTGRVGIGTTSPQAQLQISATTGSALQVNSAGQQMALNSIGLGIGTTDPALPLHVRNNDADMMLDMPNTSAVPRSEYLFGVDGQRRASVYYDKSTNKAGMVNGNTQLNLYDNGLLETYGTLGVNGMIHSTGNLWVEGDLTMGSKALKPVLLVRFGGLPEDREYFDTGVSAVDYQCTTGSWSTGRYSMYMIGEKDETQPDYNMVWLYIGDNSNWFIHTKFMSAGNPDETPNVDVLCFLNGLVQYSEENGSRWDIGD